MAAKPYNYVRLSLYGTILASQSWTVNFGIKPSSVDIDNAALAAWLTSLDPALQAWWNGAAGCKLFNSSQVLYAGARAESYENGASQANAAADHAFSSALPGTGAAGYTPTQTSICVSLLTALGGRHNRGRIYIPCTVGNLTALNKLSSANVDAAVQSTATLITAINASSLDALSVSTVVAGSVNPPAPITSCRGDNEADIQRRRANKVAPTYTKNANV